MATPRFYDTFAPIFGKGPAPTPPAASGPAEEPTAADVFGGPPADYAASEPLAYHFHHALYEACLKELGVRLEIAAARLADHDRTAAVKILAEIGTLAQANAICSVTPAVSSEQQFSFSSAGRDAEGRPCLSLAAAFFDPRGDLFPFLPEALFAEVASAAGREESGLPATEGLARPTRRLLFEEHFAPDGSHLLRPALERLVKEELRRKAGHTTRFVSVPTAGAFSLNAVDTVEFAPGVVEHHLCTLAKLNHTMEIGGPLYGVVDAPNRRLNVSHVLTSYQFVAGDGTLRFSKQGWEDIQRQRKQIERETRLHGLLQIGWWRTYPEAWGEACRGTYSFSDLNLMGQLGNMLGLLVNPRSDGTELYFFDGRYRPRFPYSEEKFSRQPWRGVNVTGKTRLDLREEADRAAALNPLIQLPLNLLQERVQELHNKHQRKLPSPTAPTANAPVQPPPPYESAVVALANAFADQLETPALMAVADLLRRGGLNHLITARVPEGLRPAILEFLGGIDDRDATAARQTLLREIEQRLDG